MYVEQTYNASIRIGIGKHHIACAYKEAAIKHDQHVIAPP